MLYAPKKADVTCLLCIKHIQDLSHLGFVINIVILSDLHISSFAQNGLGYPLRLDGAGRDGSRPCWLPMMHHISISAIY